MVNYVYTLQRRLIGLLILIEKERLGTAEGFEGRSLVCARQGHMLYDKSVVELGLAARATIVVEIVIYDITTLVHITMIW